ncbi:Thylakoid lumenal protein [Thalictrum thalictroides]|uniref:Thylakoid lumenal protein n=1 Tax=Thalictrum thalictroides TaxID=46969 RepID=A0A7J6WPM0_THATH|nr:Thylakoid lumenal protein [Thalictrum thalictroides]
MSTDKDSIRNTTKVIPSLLPEIIQDILSRLPIEDVMRSKTICKDWYALTKDPHFIHMHFSRALSCPPRILLEPLISGQISSLYLIDRKDGMWKSREISVENMQGRFGLTISSCHGLLLVTSPSVSIDPLYIYNPVTGKYFKLPNTGLKSDKLCISLGFGFDSTNKKYKVVRLFHFCLNDDFETNMKCEIITLGEESWRELEFSHTVICSTNAKPVFFDGALYWVIDREIHPGYEQILALDLCNEKFRAIKCPPSLIRSLEFPDSVFLCNLGGSLSLVEHNDFEKFRFWRIVQSNTKKSYKFYESSYHINIPYDVIIWSLNLKDRLIDKSFLFHMSHRNIREINGRKDHLTLYFPERDEYKIVEVPGTPTPVVLSSSNPSLADPTTSYNIYYGTAASAANYGGYGGNSSKKDSAEYVYDVPDGWKERLVSKVEKGTNGTDSEFYNPKKRTEKEYLTFLSGFRQLAPKDAVLNNLALSDVDLQDLISSADNVSSEERKDEKGQVYYVYEIEGVSARSLISVTCANNKLYAHFVNAPTPEWKRDQEMLTHIHESFKTIGSF